MNGVQAIDVWRSILDSKPTTLTENIRWHVAKKANFYELNYRGVADATGLGYVTIMNFAKRNHRTTSDAIDALARWVEYEPG